MKVLFPLQLFYPSQAGGPANTVYWITKNLSRPEFSPVIIATDEGIGSKAPVGSWTETEAGRAIYVPTRTYLFPLRQTIVALRTIRECDIVHLSSVFYPTAFVSGIAARLFRKKIVCSVRGELDPYGLMHSRLRKIPILFLLRRIIGRYALFHSTCDEETGYTRDIFGAGAKIVQIPNFMDIPAAVPESDEQRYLLFIGRIHHKKGIENLLAAAARSKLKDSGLTLKIAGKGDAEYEAELRKMVQDNGLSESIEFLGQVEGDDKQRLLAGAYFTIMPSHSENFGIVVIESLAQGTPAVASRGTPWSRLETEDVGFWVDNSPESLAAIIDRILEMPPDEYRAMRGRCRPFVEREFDMAMNIHRWEETYRAL